MSHVKAVPHVTTILPLCRMSLSPMSHVEFNKCPCRPVNFNLVVKGHSEGKVRGGGGGVVVRLPSPSQSHDQDPSTINTMC